MSTGDFLTALLVGLVVAGMVGYVVWYIWHNPPEE